MNFSFNKLKELANLDKKIGVEDVVLAINSIGFEVEKYEKFSDIEGIKFGKIQKVYLNPNSKKLNVCEIHFLDKDRIIQTNASNVFEGMTVVAYVPGSRIGNTRFEAKEILGITSEGMLTNLEEFGVKKDLLRADMQDNITSYDAIDISWDPIQYLGLDDYIIDVTILSNRFDAACYYVMALELSAYFETSTKLPDTEFSESSSSLEVKLGQAKSLVVIEGKHDFAITIPEQVFLAKHDIKSINDIVDLTNLTLLYSGQPTHAYDQSKVGANFYAKYFSGEVKILGSKLINLENNLTIISDEKPVAVAGVIGLEETGASSNTNNFVIELGRFNTKDIRKSIKTVKLDTDASSQSSKEISIGSTYLALKYLYSKASSLSKPINLPKLEIESIEWDESQIFKLAGSNLSKDIKYAKALQALKILGFEFIENKVVVPFYRYDIKTSQDLSEEIFRFYGYDNFKPAPITTSPLKIQKIDYINKELVSQGYFETKTYSLISNKRNIFNPFNFKESVLLETFVSKEREVIRDSQISSLFEVIEYNTKRGMEKISIFDIGMINNGIKTIALASTEKSFTELKKDVQNFLPSRIEFREMDYKNFHPGVSAAIYLDDKFIGFIAKIHPKISKIPSYFAEWIDNDYTKMIKTEKYLTDPLKFRDLTFDIPKNQSTFEITKKLKSLNPFSITIIDVFETNESSKVTLRVVAEDEIINIIDKEYN